MMGTAIDVMVRLGHVITNIIKQLMICELVCVA